MDIPPYYYRTIATSSSALTQVVTGDLDVNEYLNGSAKCWVAPEEKKQVRKKLILAPLGLSFFIDNPPRRSAYITYNIFCDALHKRGFEIYHYQAQSLVKFNFDSDGTLSPINYNEEFWRDLDQESDETYFSTEAIMARGGFRSPDEFIVIDLLETLILRLSVDNQIVLESIPEGMMFEGFIEMLKQRHQKVYATSNIVPSNINRALIEYKLQKLEMNYEVTNNGPLAFLGAEHGATRKQMEAVRDQLAQLKHISNANRFIHIRTLKYLSEIAPKLDQIEPIIIFSGDKFDVSELPTMSNLTQFTIRFEDLQYLFQHKQLDELKTKLPKLKMLFIISDTDIQQRIEIRQELSQIETSCFFLKSPRVNHASPSVSHTEPPSDPRTNLTHNLDRVISEPTDNFSQAMILYKLKQFLQKHGTLEQQQAMLRQLDIGICGALSEIFYELPPKDWGAFLEGMYDWDGNHTNEHVERLLQAIDTIYVKGQVSEVQYLGDGLKSYLAQLKPGEGCKLTNPFHVIAVKKTSEHTWLIYDPNYKEGAQTVSSADITSVVKKITQDIGTIVTLEKGNAIALSPEQQITNVEPFLEHGGLDTIIHRAELRAHFFALLEPLQDISEPALDGFRYQNLKGVPFWLTAVATDLTHGQLETLKKFLNNPVLNSKLEHSLGNIKKVLGKPSFDIATLISDTNQAKALLAAYHAALATRDAQKVADAIKVADEKKAVPQFEQAPPAVEKKVIFDLTHMQDWEKILIQMKDSKALQGFSYALQQQSRDLHRPVFVVESPKDLQCLKSWIHKDATGKGTIHKGFGGPLYTFLETNQDKHPLIIINYDQFEPADVIRFNAILDKDANLDGYAIPAGTQIVGLQNPTLPSAYLGADFSSRFDHQEEPKLEHAKLLSHIPKITYSSSAQAQSLVVYLYQDERHWKKALLGYWSIQAKGLQYHPGALKNPLPQTLIINNGPWQNSEFNAFWEKAFFQGYIEHEGERFELPEGFSINRNDSYNWETDKICIVKPSDTAPFVLNPSEFYRFFEHQTIQGQGLVLVPGLIQGHAGQTLPIYVTRDISEHQWAALLAACQSQNTQLSITLAPGVGLPEALKRIPKQTKKLAIAHARVIETNDIDASVEKLKPDDKTLVIDVSELSIQKLWRKTTLTPEFNQFASVDCVLKQELDNPEVQHIILKGTVSQVLQDSLAAILLAHPKKQISFVVEDPSVCPFLPHEKQVITAHDKEALVGDHQGIDFTEPFYKIQARLAYIKCTGIDNAWQGIDTLEVPHNFKPLNIQTSKQDAESFQQTRLENIRRILQEQPYVFLTGLSGVGKTTFVQQILSKQATIYYGEKALEDFVKDQSDTPKILFIDEANLKNTDWTMFESLYHNPPYLLVEGQKHELTNHKVVFAGNPCNYGDERHLASFFARHGNCLVFDPLPAANLYEEILKPCFTKDIPEQAAICQELIDQYQFLIPLSKTELLVSPRELQQIVLLTVSYHNQYPDTDITLVAKHFAHQVLVPLVPSEHQANFLKKFAKPPSLPLIPFKLGDYQITPSRVPISQQLLHVLGLRHFRQRSENPTQRYGGLGGMIIEGAPGIGKSELVIHTLVAQGFKEGKLEMAPSDKVFYKIPVSMSSKDIEALLLKAFDEGAVVIVDEINSAPFGERLLNDLLMGRAPEGRPPARPGFTLICTQNPMSMGGRQAPSTALCRRLQTLILPEYPKEEKISILIQKGLSEAEAIKNVEKFTNFRELIRAAERLVNPPPKDNEKQSRNASQYSMFAYLQPNQNLLDAMNVAISQVQNGWGIGRQEKLEQLKQARSAYLTNPSDEHIKTFLEIAATPRQTWWPSNYAETNSCKAFYQSLSDDNKKAVIQIIDDGCADILSVDEFSRMLQDHQPSKNIGLNK